MHKTMRFSAALLAVAIVFGCSKKADDGALVTNIKAQLFSDARTKNANLQVASADGQVTLTGSVPNDAARYEAYKIATQTPGVAKVNDQMKVDDALAAVQPVPAPPPPPIPVASKSPAPGPTPKELRRDREKEKRAERRREQAAREANQTADNVPQPASDAAVAQSPTPPPAPDQQTAPAPQAAPPPPPVPPPPPPPRRVVVPASSTITIRMIDSVDSSVNKTGEVFHASLEAPVVVDNEVIVSRGADVYVRLANASSAGRVSGQSELHLELVRLEYRGQSYPLVSSTYSLTGGSRSKNTAEKVGGGAVLGAIIGALAGGGKGAAIGAGAGAGAGGIYQASTRGKQVKIPSETKLDFQLDEPLTVSVLPKPIPASASGANPPPGVNP